ncbi:MULTISPECIES: exodeoxyribonuclease VII small subunit [Auritidibacter]|nr:MULTISPECIES: exodeoxyribonuclease VII small subunit [Auritidibacter]NIH71508.1 exodeoxyribonuclease VII small subunit [Auritidibacter ignavus]WGH81615.1 exodeoxyribonuclease VII small subunit [Auritidibacter ignavus]WGH86225.1 exodeoxyribonuclease VII small subunit [Auritidibacter ignavus]WGH88509.1 exodeoxyribonuclease VII small subunit [Auritidibacter ignavus]WGH90827.1 exodeoxyribonuclease VII small subunit [Auritidibacter ignavus]
MMMTQGFSTADTSDIAQLSYEQARTELIETVTRLESGGVELEESLQLWERGEALAQHCQRWLTEAQQRIDQVRAESETTASTNETDETDE